MAGNKLYRVFYVYLEFVVYLIGFEVFLRSLKVGRYGNRFDVIG